LSKVETNIPETGAPSRLSAATVWALIGIVAAAFVLRAVAFRARGAIDFDETYCYILGRNLVTGNHYLLNGLPHIATPPLYPLLVGLSSFITRDVSVATSLVSVLAGALLPVPVYLLGKEIHGRLAGVLAAAATAVWPALFFVAAVNTTYAQRMYLGAEPLYVLLVVSGSLCAWRLARRGGYANALLAGAFFGLASLTRPEGPVVFAFVFFWLLVDAAACSNLWRARKLLQLALVFLVMTAITSPFRVYVHHVTGEWSLGTSLDSSARAEDTLWKWTQRGPDMNLLKEHYALDADNAAMRDLFWGVPAQHRGEGAQLPDVGPEVSQGLSRVKAEPEPASDAGTQRAAAFFKVFYSGPLALVPWYAWLLVAAGLVMPPWDATRARWWAFCLSNALPMALVAVSFYVVPRYELPLIALFAIAAGKGLAAVTGLFERAAASLFGARGRVAGLLGLVPAAIVFAGMASAGARMNEIGDRHPGIDAALAGQSEDAKTARWLATYLPPHSTLMCHKPWLAVWSGLQWRVTPLADASHLVQYAEKRHIDFMALHSWQLPDESHADLLKPYALAELRYGERLFVYDMRPPAGTEVPPAARAGTEVPGMASTGSALAVPL
jgi:4-amino-4-deoxy-L-arabinose transferase-like glycosyltransferase